MKYFHMQTVFLATLYMCDIWDAVRILVCVVIFLEIKIIEKGSTYALDGYIEIQREFLAILLARFVMAFAVLEHTLKIHVLKAA